jgi:mRNA interferase RelE/StbE
LKFGAAAEKQLGKLARPDQQRILEYLHDRLATLDDPRAFGKTLRGPRFGELWRCRVGDYRLICRIEEERLGVLVWRVGHRRRFIVDRVRSR